MWNLFIISQLFNNFDMLCLFITVSFIYIQSVRIEFEVGINPSAPVKRATCDSGMLDLEFRPKIWQTYNPPMKSGDGVLLAIRLHKDQFKWECSQ